MPKTKIHKNLMYLQNLPKNILTGYKTEGSEIPEPSVL